jgi:hypothetical protein
MHKELILLPVGGTEEAGATPVKLESPDPQRGPLWKLPLAARFEWNPDHEALLLESPEAGLEVAEAGLREAQALRQLTRGAAASAAKLITDEPGVRNRRTIPGPRLGVVVFWFSFFSLQWLFLRIDIMGSMSEMIRKPTTITAPVIVAPIVIGQIILSPCPVRENDCRPNISKTGASAIEVMTRYP